jgi:tetratricopeptide (TPR) repeat protein
LIGRKARIYHATGDLERADALLKQARADEKSPPTLLETIYMHAQLRRDYAGAIELLRKAVPQSAAAYQRNNYRRWLADLERLNGEEAAARNSYEEGRAEVEEIRRREPENIGVLELLAGIHAGLGERELAIDYADRVVHALPISKDAVQGLFYETKSARSLRSSACCDYSAGARPGRRRSCAPIPTSTHCATIRASRS